MANAIMDYTNKDGFAHCRILPSVTVVRIRFRVNKSLVIFRKSSRNATYGLHCKYFITKYYAKYNLLGNGTWDLTRSLAHPCRVTPRLPRGSGWNVLLATRSRTPHEIRKFMDWDRAELVRI